MGKGIPSPAAPSGCRPPPPGPPLARLVPVPVSWPAAGCRVAHPRLPGRRRSRALRRGHPGGVQVAQGHGWRSRLAVLAWAMNPADRSEDTSRSRRLLC